MTNIFALTTIALLANAMIMVALSLPAGRVKVESEKIEATRKRRHQALVRKAVGNTTLSLALVYGLTALLQPVLYSTTPVSLGRSLAEVVAVLLTYDFLYYLAHRYPFHEWKILRQVHAVHHTVKNPTAVDSLYLHPLETTLGLSLLWISTGLVTVVIGPVYTVSFGVAFFIYAALNIIIHSGKHLPPFPFFVINWLSDRHDRHHAHMNAKNYASVTPIFDLLFGTEVRPEG